MRRLIWLVAAGCLLVGGCEADAAVGIVDGGGDATLVDAQRDAPRLDAPDREPRDSGSSVDAWRPDAAGAACASLPTEAMFIAEGELGPDSPEWERPSAIGGCPSAYTLSEVPYQVFRFCNGPTAGVFQVDVRVDGARLNLDDPVVFVYEGSAIAPDPLDCIASDDDSGPEFQPRVARIDLDPSDEITVVVTSDTRTRSFGRYELRITPLSE